MQPLFEDFGTLTKKKTFRVKLKKYTIENISTKLMFFFLFDGYKVSMFSHYDWPSVSV